MFSPDSELLHIANHVSWLFHATIGLDPLGNFSSIETLSYEVPVYEYNELGRNHSPVRLPFREPGQPGELTLRWGMIVRSKLFEWIHDVELGRDFRRHVYIFQLSRKHLPLRIYHLTGAWPTAWKASEFSTETKTALAAEEVTLTYEQIDMTNLSAVSMLGELVDEPLSDAAALLRPKSLDERHAATSGGKDPWYGNESARRFADIWEDPALYKEERESTWKALRQKWVEYRTQSAVDAVQEVDWSATAAEEAVDARREHAWTPTKSAEPEVDGSAPSDDEEVAEQSPDDAQDVDQGGEE